MAGRSIKDFVCRAGVQKRIPVSGIFELTPRCNLACKMCYIRMSPEEQKAVGRELTTEEWLTVGRQAVKAGMIYLLLTGGEPMLRPDFCLLYEELIQMGLVLSVNTNGTMITPEVIECFVKHPPESVNVTLYGASAETYGALCGVKNGYKKALEGIRALKEAGVRVVFNTTFTACNQGDMESLIAFAQEQGIPIRTAAYTFPAVRNGHENGGVCLSAYEQAQVNARFEFLSSSAEQRANKAAYLRKCLEAEALRSEDGCSDRGLPSACMAGRGLFWFSWNGQMYPCGMLSDFAAVSHGDYLDFADMWAQTRDRAANLYLPSLCKECVLRRICPSCAAVTYSNHKDTEKLAEEMCAYTRAYVRSFLELAENSDDTAPVGTNDGEVEPFTCL